jgi:hypothetical protein
VLDNSSSSSSSSSSSLAAGPLAIPQRKKVDSRKKTAVVTTTTKFDEVIRNGQVKCYVDIDIRQAPDNLPLLLKPKDDAVASSRSSVYQGVFRNNGTKWSVRFELNEHKDMNGLLY